MTFFKSAFTSLISRSVVIIVSMVTGIIFARVLGPEGKGQLAIIILNVSLLTLLTNFGTPESSIYFIGQNKFSNEQILFSLLSYSLIAFVVVFLINLLLFKLNINFLYRGFSELELYLSLFMIAPEVLNTQIRHFLLGKKEILLYNILAIVSAGFLLVAIGLLILFNQFSIIMIYVSYLIVFFLNLLLSLFIVKRFVQWTQFFSSFNFIIIIENLKKGISYFLTGMGGFWSQRLNFLIINGFLGKYELGLYSVALTLPTMISNIPNQIGLILYPYIASQEKQLDKDKFTSSIVKFSVTLMFFLIVPLFFIGGTVLEFIYGGQYSNLGLTLSILLCAMVFDGIGNILFNHFAGNGMPVYGVYLFVVSTLFLLVSGILLVPITGIVGASFSKLIAAICSSFILIYFFTKRLRNKDCFTWNKSDIALIISAFRKLKL